MFRQAKFPCHHWCHQPRRCKQLVDLCHHWCHQPRRCKQLVDLWWNVKPGWWQQLADPWWNVKPRWCKQLADLWWNVKQLNSTVAHCHKVNSHTWQCLHVLRVTRYELRRLQTRQSLSTQRHIHRQQSMQKRTECSDNVIQMGLVLITFFNWLISKN